MLSDTLDALLALGRDVSEVGPGQMVVRTVAIYAFTLVIVRMSDARLLSKATPFDYIVAIMLGSIMSRAINGSAPFGPTLAAGVALLVMHWVLAHLAVHTDWLGVIVKGRRVKVVEKGQVLEDGLRKAGLTYKDLRQALRLQGEDDDPSKIRLAHLERNGEISVEPYAHEPRIVEVAVEDGVQTVRIDLG